MGKLLDYLKSPKPIDAEPLPTRPFGLIPTKVWPILLQLPGPGSEPLNIRKGSDLGPGGIALTQQRTAAVDTRWPSSSSVAATAQQWLGLDRAVAATNASPSRSTTAQAPAAETPPADTPSAALSYSPPVEPTRPSLLFPAISGLLR